MTISRRATSAGESELPARGVHGDQHIQGRLTAALADGKPIQDYAV